MAKTSLSVFMAVVLILLTVPVYAASSYGNAFDCSSGCRPGNNSCSQCCMDKFKDAPCGARFQECAEDCHLSPSCWKECASLEETCMANYKTNFDCPDWVNPHQNCPYTCQVWNPVSRSCVGAPSNVCLPR